MTKQISLNMITCRTIKQGVGMEAGKTSQKYYDACSIIEMHADDFKKLGIWKNTNVKVTSSVGSVIVKAVETRQDLYCTPALVTSRWGHGRTGSCRHTPSRPANPDSKVSRSPWKWRCPGRTDHERR